jgi:Derlin-2/3
MLEEGSFRNKTADYAYFILLSCSALLVVSPLTNQAFLGNALTYVLAYLWSRREPYVRMNFLGLFDFAAPYLPWVLLGFNFLLTGSLPMGHMLGIAIGHLYYFLEDVWYEQHHGTRWLKTPEWFKRMFGQEPVDAAIEQHEHQD